MQVGIQITQIAECLDGYRRAGCDIIPSHSCLEDIPYRLPAAAGKFTQQLPVSEEMRANSFGDGKHHLPVRNGCEDLAGGELAELKLPLFLTRRAETAAFT